jgi:hypothetical protein
MEKFYGGGGSQNPNFRYKVRVKRPCDGAYDWCEEYPVTGSGYFQRWYLNTKEYDQGYMTYQFEIEEAAFMFLLTWGGEAI